MCQMHGKVVTMEPKTQAPKSGNGSVRDSYTESTYVEFVMPPNLDLSTPEAVVEVLTICTEKLKAAKRILSSGSVSNKQ